MLTILVCPTVRFLEACCNAHNSMSQADRIAEGERQLRELGSLRRGGESVVGAARLP
jgi:hypothetical protein